MSYVHEFVVVKTLVALVILGIDFLQGNGLMLDFTHHQVAVTSKSPKLTSIENGMAVAQVVPIYESTHKKVFQVCAVFESEDNIVDKCAIPDYTMPPLSELPQCPNPKFYCVIEKYCKLFCSKPRYTEDAWHYITTVGNPVKVPPRCIPAHYHTEVCQQIQTMLDEGVIRCSKSLWMAPAVFVPKKLGQLRICIDYQELNKRTTKDSYPLPLPDEVQDRLAGSTVFSTLDLYRGYWQLPVNPADREKTTFCPESGMGLYEFCRMPFGLSGAPSSFQNLMDKTLQGLPFVTIYLDDILVHSKNEDTHREHLDILFKRLLEAGLTLRGINVTSGCQIYSI